MTPPVSLSRDVPMTRIPDAVHKLLETFSREFSPSLWERFAGLLTAAVMVPDRSSDLLVG